MTHEAKPKVREWWIDNYDPINERRPTILDPERYTHVVEAGALTEANAEIQRLKGIIECMLKEIR